MLFMKDLLLGAGIAMFVIAAAMLAYDAYLFIAYRRRLLEPVEGATPGPEPVVRWRTPAGSRHARLGAVARLGFDRDCPGRDGGRPRQPNSWHAGRNALPWCPCSYAHD